MSSLEKRHTNRRGSTQGHFKCSDGFSDTSSVSSLMDDADREVSSLTERAFRSLCIGDDAIYNDLEVSSPAERYTVFGQEPQQKKNLKTTCQDTQYGEDGRKPDVASTFQHSPADVTQEQFLRDKSLSHISNGSTEATWQQRRSSSRVSSLVKAFSSGECYSDSGVPDVQCLNDKYRDFNESWDKSALLSIQRELSEFSSAYHQNFKSYGNNFHPASTQADPTAPIKKSSKTKFNVLNSTNLFFHSEFSPFELWNDYKRVHLKQEEFLGFVSASDFPRWYDSPLYQELTSTHRLSASPPESRHFNQRRIEDVIASHHSRPTVIQKAPTIEKRCESELASNCPPWRRNNNFVRNKLPSNRPSTVSPSNEKAHRPDSSLLYCSKHSYDIQQQVKKVSNSEMSSSPTPFNITQLLTPVIPKRQETETSEILQLAHTPLVSNCSPQSDADLKSPPDIKQLRDSYKSKASSLLFNLKDNRKRVKSTYSPTKFKCIDITEQNKQPSKMEDLSHTTEPKVTNHEQPIGPDNWKLCNSSQKIHDAHSYQMIEHKEYDNRSQDMTLESQYRTDKCDIHNARSQDKFANRDKPSNRESGEFAPHMISELGKIPETQAGTTRTEIENAVSIAHLPAHLSTQISENAIKENAGNHKQQNLVEKTSSGYINNQVTEETKCWKNLGHVNISKREMFNCNRIKEPIKGEIAALIEMDKQKEISINQHLPSANESYIVDKETYINKVNKSIKQSRLEKQKEINDTESSFQNVPSQCFPSKIIKDYPTSSQHVNTYQNNILQMSSPPKDTKCTRGSEMKSTTYEKPEAQLHKGVNHAKMEYSQKIQYLHPLEENQQKNEVSATYQPYKYDANKQWHIATTESNYIKDETGMSTKKLQLSQQMTQQPEKINDTNALTRTSYSLQQNTAQSTKTTQRAKLEEPKLNNSLYQTIYETKQQDIKTDVNTEPNIGLQTKESRFNINDILSIRDNEQAKRVRENKHIMNASVSDPIKLKCLGDVAEYKRSKIDTSVVKPDQMPQEQNSHHKPEKAKVLPVFTRKDSDIANDTLINIGSGIKPKKDMYISKENDKFTPRARSNKDRGQTKQEILTSKLKAHAQKEISAIKEKELAKQNIPPRNAINQGTTLINENGQMYQEVSSLKKEITAEKLNYLFQDVTNSSVTSCKDKDEPKYESLPTEKLKTTSRDRVSKSKTEVTDKNKAMLKEGKVSEMTQRTGLQDEGVKLIDKQNFQAQKLPEDYVQNNHIRITEKQPSKSIIDPNDQSMYSSAHEHERNPAKLLSGSLSHRTFSEEEFVVKINQTSSNMPTTYSEIHKKGSTSIVKGNNKPKYVEKTANTISGQIIALDNFLNKPNEQESNVNTDKFTAKTFSVKCADTGESGLSTKHEANALHEEEKLESRVSGVTYKQAANILERSPPKPCYEVHGKNTPENHRLVKQNINTQTGDTALQLQHSDNPQLMTTENANKESAHQTINPHQTESTKPGTSDKNKYLQTLHSGKYEDQQMIDQSKLKIKDSNNQDSQMMAEAKSKSNTQQLQQHSDNQKQMAKDKQEQPGKKPAENKKSNDDSMGTNTGNNVVKSTGTENKKSEKKCHTTNSVENNKAQQISTPPVPDDSADKVKSAPESCIIHIASKEDNVSADEPVIYNICVSSKSDAVSEEEPIIFSISVSSISDASMTDCSENHNIKSLGQAQCSPEQVENDEETFDTKNETERDTFEIKAGDSKEANVLEAEHEKERKNDSLASKSKPDNYRSTEVDNINLSYERLLVKYGLANKDTVQLKTEQKESKNEKLEPASNLSQNIQKNVTDDEHASSEKLLVSHGITKKHCPDSKNPKCPEEPPESLKEAKKTREECTTHSMDERHVVNEERAVGMKASKNTEHHVQQHNVENRTLNNEKYITAKQKMSKVLPIYDDNLNTQSTVAAKKIVTNSNVQMKGNKKVEQEGQTMLKGQKKNDNKKVDNKNAQIEQVKYKSDQNLAARIKSTVKSSCLHDELPSDNSKNSVKIGKDRETMVGISKAKEAYMPSEENSQIVIDQVGMTNDSKLQIKTLVECERNVVEPNKETSPTKDNKALQKNTKNVVYEEEFSGWEQANFMMRTETEGNMGTTSQSGVSMSNNKVAVSEYRVKKDDQSPFPLSDLQMPNKFPDKQVPKKYILAVQDNQILHHEQIKTDSVNGLVKKKTTLKVTGQITPSALSTTEGELKPEDKNWMQGSEEKNRENLKDGITTGNVDNSTTVSSLSRVKKDAECEFTNSDDLNDKTAWPHDRKENHGEKHTNETTRETTRQEPTEICAVMVHESSKSIREEMKSNVEAFGDSGGNHINVYQLQPQKGCNTVTKRNTYNKESSVKPSQYSQYHNTEIKMKTEPEKKTSKPEISALADYARLRVISAEDDSSREKDLLQKMNTYHKYKLSAVEAHKSSKESMSMTVDGTEQNKEVSSYKKNDYHNQTKSLKVPERESHSSKRNKTTDGTVTEGYNQCSPRAEIIAHSKSGLLPKNLDQVFAVEETTITKDTRLTKQMQSNSKACLTEQCGSQQAEGKKETLLKLNQPQCATKLPKEVNPHQKNPESSSGPLTQNSMKSVLNKVNEQADSQTNVVSPKLNAGETTDELQYYIVNAMESELKPKDVHEPCSLNHKTNSNKEVPEIPATGPQYNTTSPALGKPVMFKVKDNTNRSSSVIKTVKPRFHRSLSEELRMGSPKKDMWHSFEKCQVEIELEHDPRESANPPVLHELSVASPRFPGAKETQCRDNLFLPEFTTAKEPKCYPKKIQLLEKDETWPFTASSAVMKNSTALQAFKAEHNKDSDAMPESVCCERPESVCYERPESVCYERPESVCYERSESVCYERSESACSDIRPSSKPPLVPPKTEKALRRAKKLTSRRIKKSETKITSDTQGQFESKSIQVVSSLPPSPMELMGALQTAQASSPITHYHIDPNYVPPSPNIMTHSFPMTQRKLLQDPNSGQYYMVDMPVQVKTKTFFDPQTGKYLQLNVRQRAQSTLSQPASVEVLGQPCMVYPGFLPMSVSVSSVPTLRSSSHISAPATLLEKQQVIEASHESGEQEIYQPEHHRNIQQYNKSVYETHEHALHSDNNVNLTPRHTHIKTMGELEDFAVENS